MLILWYTGTSILSRIILWITRSTYSHVEIMVDGDLYSAGAKGIQKLSGDEAFRRAQECSGYAVVTSLRSDIVQAKRWLDRQSGNTYNFAGLLLAGLATLTGFRFVVAYDGAYICSGLVATALQIAGFEFPGDTRLETPHSLALMLSPVEGPYTVQTPESVVG